MNRMNRFLALVVGVLVAGLSEFDADGYTPITELGKVRASERFDAAELVGPYLVGPYKDEIEKDLSREAMLQKFVQQAKP